MYRQQQDGRAGKDQHLGGNANRAGVGVALAHHDAAHGDERRSGKAKLLGTQQGGDGEVAAGAQLAVSLQHGAAAQIVRHKGLVGLCQAELPWQAYAGRKHTDLQQSCIVILQSQCFLRSQCHQRIEIQPCMLFTDLGCHSIQK